MFIHFYLVDVRHFLDHTMVFVVFLAPVSAQRPRHPHSSTNGSAGTAISEDRNKDRFRN